MSTLTANLFLLAIATVFALLVAVAIVVVRRRRAGLLSPAAPVESLEELIPESRFVTTENGVRLHYVQAGTGPDLVLLHGIGASVFIWRFVFPILQLRHRVTAFDFAGFGKSSKDANGNYGLDAQAESIHEALEALDIQRATLVGSSMGGAIALWMAKRWPEHFPQVVGLSPATDSSRVPGFAQHIAVTAPLFRRTVNKHTIKMILGYVLSNRKLITDKVVEQYLEPFKDRGESLRAFVAATSVLSDRRLPRGLAGLASRALVVWGASDHLVNARAMKHLREILPGAEFVDHPTGGHHIMEDEPVWLARQIEMFVAGGTSSFPSGKS